MKNKNDKKIENYTKRKTLLIFIVMFGIATIVLSVLSITIKISPIFALITFVIEAILSKYRDKLNIK